MKASSARRDIVCVCLQILLIFVCIASIVVMDLWDVADAFVSIPASATLPKTDDTAAPDNTTDPSEIPDPRANEGIVDPDSGQTTPADTASVETVAIRRSSGGGVDARVLDLLSGTTAVRDGAIDYDALLHGPLQWPQPCVAIRYDELAYLLVGVMRATTPKAKTCYFSSVENVSVTSDRVRLRLSVDFVLTNKLLTLVYGSGAQHIYMDLDVGRQGDKLYLYDMQLGGDKRLNDKLISLGSDVLFGTTDYRAHVRTLLADTVAALGRVGSLNADEIVLDVRTYKT